MTDIASHRGGALLWPENSRIAFENTAKLPVEHVEFDVHPTRDGKLVVIHDDTLDRTTDGSGPVAARDWAELSRLTLKGTGGQRMLLLDEHLQGALGGLLILQELPVQLGRLLLKVLERRQALLGDVQGLRQRLGMDNWPGLLAIWGRRRWDSARDSLFLHRLRCDG